MQFNKKYAIRKLAVGVASVAIGFTTVGINPQVVLASDVTSETFGRTNSGNVDTTGDMNLPKPTDEIKAVPNGEKNFYSTVAFTTEAGLGSGTLINEDTIVTVAHNFVHLNTKNNPITVENNVNKSGDIHIATLPNGKQVKFSNDDVKYWNREGYVQGFKNDLAVIKLKNKFTGETGATLHNEVTRLSNGDRINVFGFPKGKLIPILNGTVENVENYGANIMGVAYQGSAPGMSGGGLYNANGELIGVNQNGVEGIRSGGITFSKEQLDWIKSIARGENANPVYLADEPKTDDKDKEEVHPKHGRLLYTEETTTPEKTEVVNNIIKVGTKPKVEYIGRGKNIIRKTTTYTVNSETGVVSENVKEEVNPEVDMHFYFVYSIKDESDPSLNNEYGNSKGKIIKEVEYIPEKGKWLANDTLHSFSDGNPDNDIVGAVKWPNDEKFEYNNDIYKVVGSSVEHILSGPDSNDTERSNYERDSKIWHRYPDSRLFYQLDTPVGNSVFNEDYKKLNDAGLVKDGTIVKAFLYAEPVRGTYTQTFIDEDQAKAHENDENYNPEDYSIKEKYFSGYHKLTEDLVIPKVPQYIQKDNKIYKLSSHSEEPTTKKYIDAELFTDYKYKVVHDNTTKEDITRVAPKDVYVADESRDRTSENIKTNGTEGITRTVTTYKVDNDGNLTEEVSTPEKTEVVNNVIKVGTKPKVERFEKDNKLIEKTTTYTVNEHNGEITENSTERVVKDNNKNDETVNLHYYIDYYIPFSLDEWRNGANISSKLIKSVEYNNRPTKWTKGEDLTNGLYDGVEKTVEYNGIKYKQVGLESTRRITHETTNNTDTKEYYDNYNSNWRVGTEPVFKPTVAEEGGVYRLPVFLEPQVGWITQKFYSEAYKQQTNPNINAEERYKLKDDVVLPPHSIDDKVERPNAPQYIQKANRIYKLVSNDPVPNHYEVANNSISYFYKNLNLQSTEKTVETQSLVKYKADDSKERNSENVRIDGKPKITQIITNPKVTDDGTLSEETFEEVIQNSVDTIIKVGTKPKVEYSTKGKNVIKTTTSYSVNENTGEVTETTTSEIVDTLEGLMPPVLEKDEYKGKDSTNTVLPPVIEVPEYKGTLSTNTPVDDNGELILPPTHNKEEYTQPISTNTPVDTEDNLILPPIVDIPEYKDDIVNEPQKYTKEKLEPKDSNKQTLIATTHKSDQHQDVTQDTVNTTKLEKNNVPQKQVLPKTNALYSTPYVIGLLLSAIGLKHNKKD